jgi:hypothetical protein
MLNTKNVNIIIRENAGVVRSYVESLAQNFVMNYIYCFSFGC